MDNQNSCLSSQQQVEIETSHDQWSHPIFEPIIGYPVQHKKYLGSWTWQADDLFEQDTCKPLSISCHVPTMVSIMQQYLIAQTQRTPPLRLLARHAVQRARHAVQRRRKANKRAWLQATCANYAACLLSNALHLHTAIDYQYLTTRGAARTYLSDCSFVCHAL